MRVLIAIDGGPVSEEVLAGAANVLRADDDVHLLSVIDPNEIHETISNRGPIELEQAPMDSQLGATARVTRHIAAEDVTQAAARVDTEHRRVIEGMAKHLLPASTHWTAHVQSGEHPAGVILDMADEIAAEMLVVGTRARRDIVQALLGSVAEQVIRGTVLPVMVIHTSTQAA